MGTTVVPGGSNQQDPGQDPGVDDPQDDTVTGDSTPDPAAEESEGDDNAADDGADDDAGDDDGEPGGLTPEELKAVKADPNLKKLYTSLHKGFTKKTQRFAAAERLLQSYQADPAGTVRALAQRAGVKLVDGAPATPDASSAILEELKDAVGDDLAGKLLPVLQKIAGHTAKSIVEPLRRDLDVTLAAGVEEQASLVKAEFIKRHPDYAKHEAKMMKVAQSFRPAEGADALEYMENLFYLATRGKAEGTAAARTRDRMVEAAGAGGERPGGTPGNRVAPSRPDMTKMSKRERLEAAVRAAARGEQWE